MTRQQIVDRAHSAIGHGCKYRLGQGGMKPHRAVPWDDEQECDCSGFFMWAFGLSRYQPEVLGQKWFDTTRIVADGRSENGDFFGSPEWKDALPGDGVAWPDRMSDNKVYQGHCGIVTEVGPTGPALVVHCSAGNWKNQSDAIQETNPGLFVNNRAVILRLKDITG